MKLLREPLFHFALGGAILFGGYTWLSSDQSGTDYLEPVRIGEGEVSWLSATWSRQWLRQPSSAELQGLITDLVTEELFAREAIQMGLGEDDTVIRRRLAQKLKFLVEDTTRLIEPSEAQLRAYFEANADHYQTPARLSFMQVYFNPGQHKDAASDAKAALAQLRAAGSRDIKGTIGDRFLFDAEFADVDEQSVTGIFGPEFSQAVFALEAGDWRGPVRSGYGDHLVLIEAKTPAKRRAFEEVRDQVLEEWRAEQRQTIDRDYVDRLRDKYGVVLDDSVKALLGPEPASAQAAR